MRQFKREELIDNLKKKVNDKKAVIACGAGTGITAKAAEGSEVDFIIADITASLRSEGITSHAAILPYYDSNGRLGVIAKKLLPIMKKTPVIAGIGATDPYRDADSMIDEAAELGFSGIINAPTIGMYGTELRGEMEHCGYGLDKEVMMIQKAAKKGLFTVANAFTKNDAEAMAKADADVVIVNYKSSSDSAKNVLKELKKMADAVKNANVKTLILLQCCPFTSSEELQHALEITGAHGFFGGSAIECVPAEKALDGIFADIMGLQV